MPSQRSCSAASYEAAAADYRAATHAWRLVTTTLMVAATSDFAVELCDGGVNNSQIRNEWKKQGYDLEGIDADHIWPKSRGGADHRWNFQQMEKSLNRSLGNDLFRKFMHQPLTTLRGGAVSAMVALLCK